MMPCCEGRPERRIEVDLLLRTCAQGLANGHGFIQGTHGDDVDVLGLAIHAHLMSWWLCRAGGRNLGVRTFGGKAHRPREDLSMLER